MKMDKRTEEALEKSIKHWQENVNEDFASVSAECSDCALCDLFWKNECVGCPVFLKTGLEYCDGTPFFEAWKSLDDGKEKEFREAAAKEVEFLKSLRDQPKG